MTAEKDDMFSGESQNQDIEKILEYLKGSLSDEEIAQFKVRPPEDPFLREALEGLQTLENKENLPKMIRGLNQQLHHHLAHNKSRKRKKDLRFGDWIYWSIGIILLLAVAAFLVLRLMLKH